MGDLLGPVSDNVGLRCIPPSAATGEIYSTSYYPAGPPDGGIFRLPTHLIPSVTCPINKSDLDKEG